MTNTARLLGVSASQLGEDLQSGATFSSLASQKGVSSGSLMRSIESDLQADAPQGVSALSVSQLTRIATSIANGIPPADAGRRPGGVSFSGGGGSSSGAAVQAQNNFSSLASTLGIDPGALLAQLTSGQDLSSLLSAPADTGYGTTIAASVTGVAVDRYA
ncbi:MAG: hypothetical protein ABSG43_22455 [Solirubrobacteraceae bacterium]|jgi:hypothetical protein